MNFTSKALLKLLFTISSWIIITATALYTTSCNLSEISEIFNPQPFTEKSIAKKHEQKDKSVKKKKAPKLSKKESYDSEWLEEPNKKRRFTDEDLLAEETVSTHDKPDVAALFGKKTKYRKKEIPKTEEPSEDFSLNDYFPEATEDESPLPASVESLQKETPSPIDEELIGLKQIRKTKFKAGKSYFGKHKYIEYIAGNSPIILSAPHGGKIIPKNVPSRKYGTVRPDSNTEQLTHAIAKAMKKEMKRQPHVIFCYVHRSRIDCNREIKEAAQGNKKMEHTYKEFHGFIKAARKKVKKEFKRGLYLDIHGHGHKQKRVELGSKLYYDKLHNISDSELNKLVKDSSILALAKKSKYSYSKIIRGKESLGNLLHELGYESIPSPQHPDSKGKFFFGGGYSTHTYGSHNGSSISAFQVETYKPGLRDNEKSMKDFAKAFAKAVKRYIELHDKKLLK